MYVDTLVQLISSAADVKCELLTASWASVCVFSSRRPYWSTGWLEPAVTLQRSDRTTLRRRWRQSRTNRRWWMVWYDRCVNRLSDFLQFQTHKLYMFISLIAFQITVVCDHSECPLGWCDSVAVHPLCVICRREQHSTSEEIAEEKFTRRQADICSATQGRPAAPRYSQITG